MMQPGKNLKRGTENKELRMRDAVLCDIKKATIFVLVFIILVAISISFENEVYLKTFKPRWPINVNPYDREAYKRGVMFRLGLQKKISNLPLCPEVPENLESSVDPELRIKELENNSRILHNVLPGGTYIPPGCKSRERLALVVPYRDREEQLKRFLPYMHAFLQKQQLHYTIFVAEMTQGTFNTGLLQNVGFVTADRMDNFTCFVINDVDLLPTNENNLYRCGAAPKHLCPSNSNYKYQLIYDDYYGGALAVTRDQFIKANGYSNIYFGWGKQDDDFGIRVKQAGYDWDRVSPELGIYYHQKKKVPGQDKGNPINPNGDKLLEVSRKRWKYDGLNSLLYKEVALELRDLYTWVLVDVNQSEITEKFASILPQKQHS